MPTENITRRMKYIIGDVRKLSEILRVSGNISQQAMKPITIRMTSMTISELVNFCSKIYLKHTYPGDNWNGLLTDIWYF